MRVQLSLKAAISLVGRKHGQRLCLSLRCLGRGVITLPTTMLEGSLDHLLNPA